MKEKILSVLGRSAAIFSAVLLLLLFTAYSVMWILVNGPSPTARRLFVLSVKETSAAGFLADLYLSEEKIAEILQRDSNDTASEDIDTSLIQLPSSETAEDATPSVAPGPLTPDTEPSAGTADTTGEVPTQQNATDGIEVVDIQGGTYSGKMLVISDPTRVFVGVPDRYGEDAHGLTVAAMIEKYDAVAGTNAGGFIDPNGTGTGGLPEGIVISEGELLWGSLTESYNIAGLDKNGILHVGWMTGQRALDLEIQHAASYGPALVINGHPCNEKRSLGGGLNPRTVIGQRADGAILLMVISGRSLESLGATFDDLVEVMMAHGAVNATNLDGGSSSLMIMNGENLTESAYIFGERVVATAILVK